MAEISLSQSQSHSQSLSLTLHPQPFSLRYTRALGSYALWETTTTITVLYIRVVNNLIASVAWIPYIIASSAYKTNVLYLVSSSVLYDTLRL